MSDQSGVTTYQYDDRDRLLEKASPVGTLGYAYDPQGNLTGIRSADSNGVLLTYTYDELNRLKTVNDHRSGLTMYHYDAAGNLQDFILPNSVNQVYDYDALNRLTNVAVNRLTSPVESYAYALGPSGHRLIAREGNGRLVTYQYDNLYRLTRETILGASPLGDISYTLDPVGNRISMNSTVLGIPSQVNTFDANDRLDSDSYDANGNTAEAAIHDSLSGTDTAFTYSYDFENRVLSAVSASSAVNILYDGDGNRVRKTVTDTFGTRRTRYLVDDRNPTGYSQVFAEFSDLGGGSWTLDLLYNVGLDVISRTQIASTNEVTHFFGYDGHGNVRFLTASSGVISDRYDYDAFGNLIARSGTTPNNLLYCGEQFDPDLGLYFLRARYMDVGRGRFWSMDEFPGVRSDPLSLHKYLYANSDPVNGIDPSGKTTVTEVLTVGRVVAQLSNITIVSAYLYIKMFNPSESLTEWSACMDRRVFKYMISCIAAAELVVSTSKEYLGETHYEKADPFTSLARHWRHAPLAGGLFNAVATWMKRGKFARFTTHKFPTQVVSVAYYVASGYVFYSAIACAVEVAR